MDRKTDYARPIRLGPKRRRRGPELEHAARAPSTSDSDSDLYPSPEQHSSRDSTRPHSSPAIKTPNPDKENHSNDDVDVDIAIQKNNAYPGSTNTIGSIHQRRWYLSLDRESSGFEPVERVNNRKKKTWVRKGQEEFLGFVPFYVRGPDVERSVVTGRLASDVLSDEGVQGFRRRKGWRPVLN